MHIQEAQFITSALQPREYPVAEWPDIAFAGRSNVGKSSLINALTGRKQLVRTSRTPGRTQRINFFLLNNAFYLVDLPGYGYAKAPKSLRYEWGERMHHYLAERQTLCAVVLLLDFRRQPSPEDMQLLDWLEQQQCPTIPVLTKMDKLSGNEKQKQLASISKATGLDVEHFSCCSSERRQGLEELWQRIDAALADFLP